MTTHLVYLDTTPVEIPVTSDSYVEGGSFLRFYNDIDGKKSTVAVFATHHVVAILKQHK